MARKQTELGKGDALSLLVGAVRDTTLEVGRETELLGKPFDLQSTNASQTLYLSDEDLGSSDSDVIAVGTQAENFVNDIVRSLATPEDRDVGETIEFSQESKDSLNDAAVVASNMEAYVSTVNSALATPLPADVVAYQDAYGRTTNSLDISQESFDPINKKRTQRFTLIGAGLPSTTDKVASLFYRVVNSDAASRVIKISATMTSIVLPPLPDADLLSGSGVRKVPYLTNKHNLALFGNPANKFIPRKIDANLIKLNVDGAFVDESTGVPIETAPLKPDTDVSLANISNSKVVSAGSDITNRMAMSACALRYAYFTVGTGETKELLRFDFKNARKAQFFGDQTNSNVENMRMNLELPKLFSTGIEKMVNGSFVANTLFTALNIPEHSIKVDFNITGTANRQTTVANVDAKRPKFLELRNESGGLIASDAVAYTDTKALIETMEFVGWFPEAFNTNSTQTAKGMTFSIDEISLDYEIPTYTSITLPLPVASVGKSTDEIYLRSGITQHQGFANALTLDQMKLDFDSLISNKELNGDPNYRVIDGVAGDNLIEYGKEIIIDVKELLETRDNQGAKENLKALILNKIQYHCNKMYVKSNYNISAKDDPRSGVTKPKLIFGTSSEIKGYISDGNSLDLGSVFNTEIEDSDHPMFDDTIYCSFGASAAVSAYQWGTFAKLPTIITDTTITSGDETFRELSVNPRFRVITTMGVGIKFKILNIESAFGKNVRLSEAVA